MTVTAALAGLVNFTLHLDTIGGTQYAADYPYYVEQTLRETLGQDFVLLFGNGTCGDINHIDVTSKDRLKTDTSAPTLVARWPRGLWELEADRQAAVWRSDVRWLRCPSQQFTPAEIEQAKKDMDKIGTCELPFLDQVRAYKIVDVSREARAFLWRCRCFVSATRSRWSACRARSSWTSALRSEGQSLPDDARDRVVPGRRRLRPDAKAFAEGSYETVNSRIATGGGEMMAEAAIRLLKELGPARG